MTESAVGGGAEDSALVVPRTFQVPREPTRAERERHALTHLPFQPWCELCVRGQGRERGHCAVDASGTPIVELGYCFLRSADPDDIVFL